MTLIQDPEFMEAVYKILVSIVIGSALGFEREMRRKAAGIRTITLLCVGSTLFTILSMQIGHPNSMDRVASNILTGVGFIGAGVIFKGEFSIDGITTATTIWIAAALGMAIGMDRFWLAGVTLALALLALTLLSYVEIWIARIRDRKYYTLLYKMEECNEGIIEEVFKSHRLQFKKIVAFRKDDVVEDKYEVTGSKENMLAMNQILLRLKTIQSFTVQSNA
ncbi:putative Mg2+ transporter-C (MgtC) family protein [Chitinophaga skermanii]|uniref:Putative Mg2+ transporter-C (MgtC) family protein n=1 Tax=Chitinophaga skermanii TaxID=331697 RepID=A0A327QR67_9BACT|nr:MgtC/SapB family protein [Chitinophaga skermanii]RAJ06741.1 putative Mg2+ transporter-C (MgtC) family protein [Chitinophaga skermanii]